MSHNAQGRLIAVSLGPGEPGLITRRAWDALHQKAHWTYPIRRKGSDSYALDIVLRAGLQPPEAHTPLVFPMSSDTAILAKYWANAAQTTLELLHGGEDVAFLVEGDASTYATFIHLARTVKALDDTIEIEIIPGVSSFHAAAAHLQVPLADTDDTVAIIPAGYGLNFIENVLDDFDTLVLLKVKPLLDDIIELLRRRDLLVHSHFIEKVGAPEERVVHNVASLYGEKVNYLSLMIVKNPKRVRGELLRGCRKHTTQGEPA